MEMKLNKSRVKFVANKCCNLKMLKYPTNIQNHKFFTIHIERYSSQSAHHYTEVSLFLFLLAEFK